jgi:hypothetical protein
VIDEVHQLLATGRIGVDEVVQRLAADDLRLLKEKARPDADYPRETYESLIRLLERGRPSPWGAHRDGSTHR